MYNRYIPRGASYVRVRAEDDLFPPSNNSAAEEKRKQEATPPHFDFQTLLGGKGEKKEHTGGITGMLKALKLDELDTGDILLLLIILFLFLEGDNMELVITLGLMLLFGLGDKAKREQEN